MNGILSIEKERNLLQKKLDLDLQIENALKLQINREFEELKHLEVSLERFLEHKRSSKKIEIRH